MTTKRVIVCRVDMMLSPHYLVVDDYMIRVYPRWVVSMMYACLGTYQGSVFSSVAVVEAGGGS